jgi:DNA-binding CsgD family transcriptional regulator
MRHIRVDAQWLELIGGLLATPLMAMPADRIALQLTESFGLVGASYELRAPGRAPQRQLWPLDERFGGHRAEIEQWRPHRAIDCHPIARYYLATGDPAVIQVTDVPDRFADRHVVGAWKERASQWGCVNQIALPLHLGDCSHRVFVLGRSETFSPAEMQTARRLQRLLLGLDRQVLALSGAAGARPGLLSRPTGEVRLTAREVAVLALVADGHTAGAVARRLLIGERTVHKHLQHLYGKLGVTDRLSAVLAAQRLGVLPPPPDRNVS